MLCHLGAPMDHFREHLRSDALAQRAAILLAAVAIQVHVNACFLSRVDAIESANPGERTVGN
jgi:hypothetical protein